MEQWEKDWLNNCLSSSGMVIPQWMPEISSQEQIKSSHSYFMTRSSVLHWNEASYPEWQLGHLELFTKGTMDLVLRGTTEVCFCNLWAPLSHVQGSELLCWGARAPSCMHWDELCVGGVWQVCMCSPEEIRFICRQGNFEVSQCGHPLESRWRSGCRVDIS